MKTMEFSETIAASDLKYVSKFTRVAQLAISIFLWALKLHGNNKHEIIELKQ